MASDYPVAAPASKTDYDSDTAVASSLQNAQGEDINAIAAKVGIDSSAVTTSHDYKLSEVTSTDKAVGKTATQTLTSKTLTGAVLTAGSTTVAPLKFLSGTNLTTPVAGVIEFDGTDFYLTI